MLTDAIVFTVGSDDENATIKVKTVLQRWADKGWTLKTMAVQPMGMTCRVFMCFELVEKTS